MHRQHKQRDQSLLEGAQGHIQDILRTLHIAREFFHGFRTFRNINRCITIFGSARFTEDNPYYQLARETGQALGRAGFTVMTGGGPGIMEAANRGAQEVGTLSVGCNIQLPEEQQPNPYLDIQTEFEHFFVRKVMLVKFSSAFITLPGGFGTLDEIYETLNLIETAKIERLPIVVMGSDYWEPMLQQMMDRMSEHQAIDIDCIKQVFVTDSPEQAVKHIQQNTP